MLVWANMRYTYYYDQFSVDTANMRISGVVLAGVLPTFENFTYNSQVFSADSLYEYEHGWIGFGASDIFEISNPFNVSVTTSHGTVSGNISYPDTITSLVLNVTDTLPLNTPLTITWTGSNADFYHLSFTYRKVDSAYVYDYEYYDTLTTSTTVNYDASVFSRNGEIAWLDVQPVNGPMPEANTAANMNGAGSGFLYCETDYAAIDSFIVVGTGIGTIYYPYKRPAENRAPRPDRTRQKVMEVLGYGSIE
jgi:hypothetical protein